MVERDLLVGDCGKDPDRAFGFAAGIRVLPAAHAHVEGASVGCGPAPFTRRSRIAATPQRPL